MTEMPLVNPGLTEGQDWLEPLKKNIFHVFTSNPSYLEILVNFDQVWPEDTKNPNSDPAIKMGWN